MNDEKGNLASSRYAFIYVISFHGFDTILNSVWPTTKRRHSINSSNRALAIHSDNYFYRKAINIKSQIVILGTEFLKLSFEITHLLQNCSINRTLIVSSY